MKIAVRYFSRGGNTKKIADAIAKAAETTAKDCSAPIEEPIDLLFLGGSVYGMGLDDTIKKYIEGLDAGSVKNVALFSTSALVKSGNQEMSKLLKEKNITVIEKDFYCRGAFTVMHRGHPNENDLKKAGDFARTVVNELQEAATS